MADTEVTVQGEGNWSGALYPAPDDPLGDGTAHYLVRPHDGGVPLLVPAALFRRQPDGSYFLPVARTQAEQFANSRAGELTALPTFQASDSMTGDADGELVVPIVEEQLRVGKRVVEKGRVRVVKTVTEREEIVNEPLQRDEVSVERIAVNRTLAGPEEVPPVRQEGDTMIVPVVEEVLVWQKQLVLKEELHITRRTQTVTEPVSVTVRREEARIERVPAALDAEGNASEKRAETVGG